MNAVRIRKRLDAPIPQLPELTPMIGKEVEIIVLEETPAAVSDPDARGSFWNPKSAQELAEERGIKPVARFEDLLGGWPEDQLNDGFEEAVDQWRREPWRSEDPFEDTDPNGNGNG